jgi:hypothetical protein
MYMHHVMNGMKKSNDFTKGTKNHVEKYCIDCILKLSNTKEKKKKIENLFSELPKENFHDERIMTLSQVSSFLVHPQQL